MTIYAQPEDYKKCYSDIKDEELSKYLELASIAINNATLTRIERRGFFNLTTLQQDMIQKATIEEAHYLFESETLDDGDIESYSITDISVTEKESIASKLQLSKVAYMYLRRTGLTNRII